MGSVIGTLLYDAFNSQLFWVTMFLWLILGMMLKSRRSKLTERVIQLWEKPLVFVHDEKKQLPLYNRDTAEKIANSFKSFLLGISEGVISILKKWIKILWKPLYREDRPFRIAGYIIFLLLFCVFLWADAIAIIGALDAFGAISWIIPDILKPYDIAVAMGSLLAVVVAGILISEIKSPVSRLTDWEDHKTGSDLANSLAKYLLVSGLVVAAFLGVMRLYGGDTFAGVLDTPIKNAIQTILYLVVPINTIIAAYLVSNEAIKGLFILAICLLAVILGPWIVLHYFVVIPIAWGLPVIVDYIYRFLYMIFDVIFYYITTPILMLLDLIPANHDKKTEEKTE